MSTQKDFVEVSKNLATCWSENNFVEHSNWLLEFVNVKIFCGIIINI